MGKTMASRGARSGIKSSKNKAQTAGELEYELARWFINSKQDYNERYILSVSTFEKVGETEKAYKLRATSKFGRTTIWAPKSAVQVSDPKEAERKYKAAVKASSNFSVGDAVETKAGKKVKIKSISGGIATTSDGKKYLISSLKKR